MVVRVCMSRFAANVTAQGAVRFTVDVCIKEGDLLGLHSELNVLVVVRELRQLAWTMVPDEERVIHVAKPAERLVVHPLPSLFFKVLSGEVWRGQGKIIQVTSKLTRPINSKKLFIYFSHW
jgi:hypothetical protein